MDNAKEVITKIRNDKHGYWYINFYPINPIKNRIQTLEKCENIIRESTINLRGWDYPHYPKREDGDSRKYFGDDYFEAFIDWWEHKEAWRFYQSAQFIHYMGIHEDWFVDNEWATDNLKRIIPGSVLDVINTIYTVSEIFEFIRNLIKLQLYDDGLNIEISLNGIQGRKLILLDTGRAPLMDDYIAHIPHLKWSKKEIKINDFTTKSDDMAFELICYIFTIFNWKHLPVETIKHDQLKFLQRH